VLLVGGYGIQVAPNTTFRAKAVWRHLNMKFLLTITSLERLPLTRMVTRWFSPDFLLRTSIPSDFWRLRGQNYTEEVWTPKIYLPYQ
jgi:hypothetical protein